jgi:outer membrane receptor protein involved in Fe transport
LTSSWEIGGDLRFLNNRISLDATYYDGKTTNQILRVQIPDASGYTTAVINAGEIRNHGVELSLNISPVKTASGFSWDIAANYSRNHSQVVSLAPGIETLPLNPGSYFTVEARIGHPYGDIVGTAYQRAPDGQLLVTGGSYLPTTNTQVLGNITPKWIGGINNIFTYKGLSLNILLDFVQGNKITSATKYQEEAKGTGVWTTEGRRLHDIDPATGEQFPLVGILPGVKAETDADGNVTGYVKNDIAVNGQTYWAGRAWGGIDQEFVLDGSYISLREIVLSYSLNPKLLSKTPFAGLSLSLIGRNLAYLEQHMQGMGIAPESSPNTAAGYAGSETISMPSTRTIQFDLKVSF